MEVIKLGENYPDDKPDKETTKKGKLQAKIHNEYWCKNPQQNTSKYDLSAHSRTMHHYPIGFIPAMHA